MRRAFAATLCCGILAALASGAGAEVGDTPDHGTWVTDGFVYSIARAGDRTFIGGDFSHVGRRTGPGVQLAPVGASNSGLPSPGYGSFPEVAGGRVLAAVSDRAGGWFIGGDFTSVGGSPRSGIAHLEPDDSGGLAVDPGFAPRPAGTIRALALGVSSKDSNVLYIGGSFASLNGDPVLRNFAAVDADTGATVGVWPAPDGAVTGLDVLRPGATGTDYAVVFIAGDFANIGGTAKNRLGAIWGVGEAKQAEVLAGLGTAITGVRAVRAGVATKHPTNAQMIGAPVYVAGNSGLASIKFTITAGNPPVAASAAHGTSPAFTCNTALEADCIASVRTLELSDDGATLYVGGRFNTLTAAAPFGTKLRRNLAAIRGVPDVHAAAPPLTLRSWQPEPNGAVGALARHGAAVYAGGDFTEVLGVPQLGLAAIEPAAATADTQPNDARLIPWDPRVAGGIPGHHAGTVNVLVATSGGVYAGGSFTAAEAEPHDNLAAFDATGGLVKDWTASTNAPVLALAAGNDRLYLGGLFTDVTGHPRKRLAAVGATGTGQVDASFAPAVEAACEGAECNAPVPGVLTLALTDQTLYVGGSFAWLGGAQLQNAGAVNALDGRVLSWAPNPDDTVYSLLATCGTVYAGGAFSNAGGYPRSRIAALDPGTGGATGWNPSANGGAVYALARDGNVVYAGGSFATIGGTERQRLAGLDATTGEATSFAPNIPGTGDFVRAIAAPPGAGVVYAGGQITKTPGARSYAAAFDSATGATTAWESGADSFVRALAPFGDALLVGGEFRQLGRQMQQGFGSFGLATAGEGQALSCAPPPEPVVEEPVVEEPQPEPQPEPPALRAVEPAPDTTAPVLGRVRLTNTLFRTAERSPSKASAVRRRRTPVGTRFRGGLSEAATVRLAFSRRIRVQCKSRRAKKPCYRWRPVGSKAHACAAGSFAIRFRGKVAGRWLRPGRYRVRVRAVDAAGNRSAPQRRAFTVVRR